MYSLSGLLLRASFWLRTGASLTLAALLGACSTAPPPGITAVAPFDAQRYAGRWFEIARLDNRFERGLTDINATYRPLPDGSLQVINRGFDPVAGQWEEAIGRAQFIGDPQHGSLKVSFFGPFYGGYHVAALDEKAYRWSLVVGSDRDYFWILARDRQLPAGLREELLGRARRLGIATDQLIWVSQQRNDH